MTSSSNDSPLGSVERFRVESRLGRGGMGEVFKAYDTVLERTVAVKTLTPGSSDAQGVERLLREARACARLTHPAIVTIHDVLRADGGVYIVMEHLPGASLESLGRFPRFSSFEAKVDILIRILDALHYAHGRGVVHRDIKPTNVQLLPDGSVKLLDFGIAHMAGAASLTMTGTISGTAHYASPEQLRGEESDARTDIYSTGILAYQMLTRRRPFDGDAVAAVLTKVLHDPLPAMGTSLSDAFPEIERIVRRAAAKRREDRYASADDMKNALAAFLAGSREAIVAKQAEITATTQRVVVEARSLIASGRMAEATPLLASALRSNPDAEEARSLLQTDAGASEADTGPAAAPQADTRPTLASEPDRTTSAAMSAAAPAPAVEADAGFAAAAPPPPRSSRRLLIAAAAVLLPLTGAALLGPRWMSPGPAAPGDPPSPGFRPGLIAAGAGAPTVGAPAAGVPAAGVPTAGASAAEVPAAGAAEEVRARVLREPETAAAESVRTTVRLSRDAAGGGREGGRSDARPSAAAATPPSSPAAPPPAPAATPSPPPAAPGGAPPASAPPAGAKNLYYAATPPGPASSAAGASSAPVAGGAVNPGIKYRILRRAPDGTPVEVDADTLFQSGDRIRFAFEPNIAGFLYVVQRGSSGRWSVLLPHPQINGGHNAVAPFGEVSIPPEGWFRFDETAGTEEVFVYLSREPIVAMPWGGGSVVSAQFVDQPTMIELANSVRSRDLVFEKEDAPDTAQQAAYVVNQGNLRDAVAWTVELSHR